MICSSTPLCFPGCSAGKEFPCNAGNPSLIPGLKRCPGEGIPDSFQYSWASLVVQTVQNLPAMQETWVRSLGWEDPLEKAMATHSSILAWKILQTEDIGGLQSTGSQRVTKFYLIDHKLSVWYRKKPQETNFQSPVCLCTSRLTSFSFFIKTIPAIVGL